jgi:hypothetical protein
VRNIFDQYDQPENRLTHALATALDQERLLLIPFLRWLGIQEIPKPATLMIAEQQVPGSLQEGTEDIEAKGLPDAAVFDEDGWAVLFESKIQASINLSQVDRHRRTAARHGFESPWVVVISVDKLACTLPTQTVAITWQDVYAWFNQHSTKSLWARQLVDYMQVFERKMLLRDYQIRGTITVFDGLRFDEDTPYTYREGKRLIRLLGDSLQQRADLKKLGIDPQGERRPAITGKGMDGVWDFLPLQVARNSPFTAFPHLTLGIYRKRTTAAITVPNGVRGGFRSKLARVGEAGFMEMVAEVEKRLRPVLKRSNSAKPMMYATQRHFKSQRSPGETDARLDADLRTAVMHSGDRIRYQPQWLAAIYKLLVERRSNIQFGCDVQFSYDCKIIRSSAALDLFADTWKALWPLAEFTLQT